MISDPKYIKENIKNRKCGSRNKFTPLPWTNTIGTSLRHLLSYQFCIVLNTCSQSQIYNKNLTQHAILWIMETNFSKEMMNNIHEK